MEKIPEFIVKNCIYILLTKKDRNEKKQISKTKSIFPNVELEYVQRLSHLFRARHIPDLSIYGIFEGYFYKFFDIFRDFRNLKGKSTLA